MKAILISVKPQYVADILNGNKTLEIRKTMPKCDLPIDVYIYCTKGKLLCRCDFKDITPKITEFAVDCPFAKGECGNILNGKVVAKFTLNKVGEIHCVAASFTSKRIVDWNCDEFFAFEEHACLTQEDLDKYLGKVKHSPQGYAWRIDNLVVFDKPKELGKFSSKIEKACICFNQFVAEGTRKIPLTKAPQSWCYVEV